MIKVLIVLVLFYVYLASGITVDEIIKEALKSSPYIKEKSIDLQIAETEKRSIKATRSGQIKLYGSYFNYEDSRILYPIAVPLDPAQLIGARDQFVIGISYFVPLFTGFKLRENVDISSIKEKISKIEYDLTKNQLIFNIKSTYIKILQLQKQRQALQQHLKALEKLKEDIEISVKLGRKTEVDLLKVQYSIKDTKTSIEKLENSIEYLKFSLKVFTGNKNIKLENLEEPENESFYYKTKNITSLEKIEKISNLEKIQLKKQKIAKGKYLPEIYFLVSAQRNYGNGEYKDLYQIGIKIDYTLFDFGKRKNEYLKSKLELSKIKIQKQKAILETEKQIQKALSDIKSAQSKIEKTKKQIELAKKIEEIERLKYEEGISDLYNYLYAKSQLISAKTAYYSAVYEKKIAVYYLQYILEEFKDD